MITAKVQNSKSDIESYSCHWRPCHSI